MPSSSLKSLALSFLPDCVLQPLKRVHYLKTVQSISEADEPDFRIVSALVAPGDNVLDIGANIGAYTRLLSRLVGHGRVISVEPMRQTFDILRSNVSKLGLGNVELRNVAIAEAAGEVVMEVPQYQSGGANFYQARIIKVDGNSLGKKQQRVQATTIDQLVGSEEKIAFVKVDVEGFELPALRSAEKLIQRNQPAWLIEVSGDPDQADTEANKLFQLMAAWNYRPFWFDGSRLRLRSHGDKSVNYFFLTDAHRLLIAQYL